MIYVECKPDTILVRTLTGLPRRDVIHELKGKYRVVDRVSKGSNLKGLVDEDPLVPQPVYLEDMDVLVDLPGGGLRLLHDAARGNRIIILCPRLEEWTVRAARDAGVDLGDYSLPNNPRMLHRVVNDHLSSFQRLVEDLKDSDRLRGLHNLLNL
jgi:hypothetical protein